MRPDPGRWTLRDPGRSADRDRATAEAYRSGAYSAYSMQAIAEYLGVSRMTISRAVKRHEDAAAETLDVTTLDACPWTLLLKKVSTKEYEKLVGKELAA